MKSYGDLYIKLEKLTEITIPILIVHALYYANKDAAYMLVYYMSNRALTAKRITEKHSITLF